MIELGTCIKFYLSVTDSKEDTYAKYVLDYLFQNFTYLRCYIVLGKMSQLSTMECMESSNPTIASYNASGLKNYNATSSLVRFKTKNICFRL
jgi:hypothetical protein